MEVVNSSTKTIELRPQDLPALVHEKVLWLETNYGPSFKPLRILFGPDEYLLLMKFVQDNRFYGSNKKPGSFMYPDEFMGYPIGLKMTPGIEMELNVQNVMTLAKGRITVP